MKYNKITGDWNAIECDDPILEVGMNTVMQLLWDPSAAARNQVGDLIRSKFGYKLGDPIDTLTINLAIDSANLGIRLGYALARVSLNRPYDSVVQAAITEAGLVNYSVDDPYFGVPVDLLLNEQKA